MDETTMKISKGDILIDRKTRKTFPVADVSGGCVYFELRRKLVKRALGQVIKHMNKFEIVRAGETLSKDYAFYCPRTERMIVLKQGTIFLGEL
jgi:hypothetical protein